MITLKKIILAAFAMLPLTSCGRTPPEPISGLFDDSAGGELKIGHYVGFITLDTTQEKLALTADSFIVQPEDFTQFPKLNMIYKIQLGGYGTAEYVSEVFEDIRYDFNNGVLTLDEVENDLVISAEIHGNHGPTRVVGRVFFRASAVTGSLSLSLVTDEPDDDDDGDDDPNDDLPFVQLFSGQYEGRCDERRAAMQLVAGKNLVADAPEQRGLHGYGIAARLAYDDPTVCGTNAEPDEPTWCVMRNFASGRYQFTTGQLVLEEPNGITPCTLLKGHLECRVRMLDHTAVCVMDRVDRQTRAFRPFPRRYFAETSPAQRAALPEPDPPSHASLVAALRGMFAGWLHNETTNRYTLIRLNVMPTVSTPNPHNENQVFVSATAISHFGRAETPTIWTQAFDRRAFFPRPGFLLESQHGDAFVSVEEWRQGLIRGTWLSHAFGRVGTLELVKGGTPPPLPSDAMTLPSIAGEYQGPDLGSDGGLFWWIRTVMDPQPVERERSTVLFSGEQALSQLGVRVKIARGAYDPYSEAISWLSEERDRPRLVNGVMGESGDLMLIWPGAPIWGVPLPEYLPIRHRRIAN